MSKKFICLAAVCLTLAVTGSAGAQLGKGKVLFEYFDGITGTAVTNLTSNANYPNKPTSSEWRDNFKSTDRGIDNYGIRARAYLTPPADGDYTFWVASDDASELWLSTDDTPGKAVKIATVAGWTNADEWANATEKNNQKSAAITLKGGQNYFIQALMKEGTGGDNLSVGWAGPVIGNATTVIAGQYCTAVIRDPEPLLKAKAPKPASGAVDVTTPLFEWTPGIAAVMHDIYMGTNPTPGAAEYRGPMPMAMYYHILPLEPGVKYYWRIDEVDATGGKTTGDVWNFTVMPLEAHAPDPSDGMMGRALTVQLKWTAGQGAAKHKVFVSADKALVTAGDAKALVAEQAETSFSPAGLAGNTTYYWRVDEVDGAGKVVAGPVWSFGTIDPAGGAVAEYWNGANLALNNLDLLGAATVVTTVPNVNFSWPSGTVKGTNSPDAAINTDYFAGRFTAQLNVPVSGKYKLIESTDDGGLLFLNGQQIAGAWATGGEAEFASAELDLVAGEQYILVLEYFEATSGAAARLRWSGPGISKQVIWQGALGIPPCAISPVPGENATEVRDSAVMSWIPAPGSVQNFVYFGTDKAKVTAGDASVLVATTPDNQYVPAALLKWNTTYYWKVDSATPAGMVSSLVWSFKTADWLPIQQVEVPLNYDNTVDPYATEIELPGAADWTANGITDLALRFIGQTAAQGTFSFDGTTYAVGGAGADIWGNADQFTYGYKALQGDGTMIARVVSDDKKGANTWSKAGVMIRQSLAAGSTHAFMPITAGGGNGRSFQRRLVADLASTNADGPAPTITAPYWVKIERKGNDFSGFVSVDGVAWVQVGTPVTIAMTDPVFIGLAVTSHVAGTVETWTFDSVSSTGNVVPEGPITSWKVINTGQNATAPLYVALEDAAGATAVVTHPDAAAVNRTVWDLWRIPVNSFTGIDLKNVKKMYIGVGDGQPDGSGLVRFTDVRVLKPVAALAEGLLDVTMKGDPLVGLPNDGVNAGGNTAGWPAAEVPANLIDDSITTKFLHFKGDVEPSGFSVTPAIGYSIVTGLTFTTANDAADRDPVSFEVYGAHASLDGPWTLIAKGAIDDFARPLSWPRRWKNVTPIAFSNGAAFAHYKVMFPTVRKASDGLPVTPNSMQIAEVELLGVPGTQPIITDVVRANGTSGNRSPVGVFTGDTQCLPTQAGGLKDGNIVYSDRDYPWNQTPKELVGAEYVRIFNTDKGTPPSTYTVTTSRLATVAVAHDDRNTPAQAAVDKIVAAFAAPGTFKDTGLDVFIYESASTPARPLSVFAADLPAGTYVFASEQSSNTMYIIGAIEKQ